MRHGVTEDEREMRPMSRESGNARPQAIARLLTKMAPELQRRHPGCSHWSPIFDADGRPVDFKPNREVRAPAPSLSRRGGKTLAEGYTQQARADARWRQMNQPRTPSGRTLVELQRELDRRMDGWRR